MAATDLEGCLHFPRPPSFLFPAFNGLIGNTIAHSNRQFNDSSIGVKKKFSCKIVVKEIKGLATEAERNFLQKLTAGVITHTGQTFLGSGKFTTEQTL